MTATTSNDKHPTADPAEYDAFFPFTVLTKPVYISSIKS